MAVRGGDTFATPNILGRGRGSIDDQELARRLHRLTACNASIAAAYTLGVILAVCLLDRKKWQADITLIRSGLLCHRSRLAVRNRSINARS
jgi:hypothetical protein